MKQDTPPARFLLTFILICVSYVVLGYLSLQLEIPPGYVAAIFPPAGLALAALIIWGRRYAVAIFFGSFLLDFIASPLDDRFSLPSLILCMIVGLGAMLQALAGWFLVRRFTQQPLLLVKNREILVYTVLLGPLSCLVNSVIGTTGLYLVGFIGVDALLPTWFIWWVGDSIGVALMSLLLFSFFLKPLELWRPRRVALGVPILCMTAIILGLFVWGSKTTSVNLQQRFEAFAGDLSKKIDVSFTSYVDALAGLERLVTAQPDLTAEQFEVFTRYALRTKPGLNGLSWNPIIGKDQRAAFEEDVQRQGFDGFRIYERDADNQLVVSAEKEQYVAVKYIQPYAKNKNAHGFDVGSNAKRLTSLNRARDHGRPQATPRITLVQEEAQQAGILLFYPVYRGATETLEQRRQHILGFAVGVFRVGDIVSALIDPVTHAAAHLAIFDESDDPPTHLYGETDITPFANASLRFHNSLVMGDRTWEVYLWPKTGFVRAVEAMVPWFVTVTGLVFTVIVAAFLLILTGTTYYLNYEVQERTQRLVQLNKELEQFAYIASHDLQEPVRTVGSFVNLLNKQYSQLLDEQGKEYMQFCVVAAQRMRQLIHDLLDYSKIGSSKRPFQVVDVQATVEDVLDDLQVFLEENQATVTITRPLPRQLVAEPGMLRQLIQNLIKNGIKFKHANRTPEISIAASETPRHWIFSFADNGIGIEQEHLESIFIIFRRLHTREQYEGTGIGLAVAKRIVTHHQGEIWVDSTPGTGSTFHFSVSKKLFATAEESPV